MRAFRGARHVALVSLALLLLATTAAGTDLPNSMSATGDSITRAFNTGRIAFTDAPQNSWSTGTSTQVNSHYLRILAGNSAISGKNYNDAKSGAKMADLSGQMQTVVSRQVGYVTVLMGGNDVCTSTEAGMTPVADFATQFKAAMDVVTTGSPQALVFVASIPDAYHLWEILKDNRKARSAWDIYDICQSLLANPLSTAQADADRRLRVRQRNIDFNTQLGLVCASYTQCRFDGNAVFKTAFTANDVSTRDYFHPSVAGQAKLASVTWAVSYWGP